MSAFKSAFGERGHDHAAKQNFSPGNSLAAWPLSNLPVPGYGLTSNHIYPFGYAPAGATSMPPYRFSYPYWYYLGNGAPAFAHNSHAFGFTPINAGTSAPAFGQNSTATFGFTPINGGTSVPAFGQNSTATFGSAPRVSGTSVPAFGQNGATPFGSVPAFGGTSMPAFGQNGATPFGSAPAFGGTSMPAFGRNGATFGSLPGNGGTYMPAFGQNGATFGSLPRNGGTSVPAFGQNSATFGSFPSNGGTSMPTFSTPFGCAPTNGGTSVPTFGRSINSFGSTPSNTITSVPAWQHSNPLGPVTTNGGTPATTFGEGRSYFPPTPTDGATFASTPTNGATFAYAPTNGATSVPACGAPLSSTLTQAAPLSPICGSLSGSTSCLQTPAVNPSSSPGFSFCCTVPCNQPTLPSGTSSLFGTDPSLFGTQNQLSGSTTHFQTPKINASSSPGFGFGGTTSGQTTTQFGTIGNINETSSCSNEVQSPFSGCQVKTPSPLTFRISRGGSRVTPYTETVELDPGSQRSTRFMSISAMPVFRDKCHEELRWEDKQFGDNGLLEIKPVDVSGGGVDPDLAQLNCFRNPVSRTGSLFQFAMPSSVSPNISASSPPFFTFPTCSTPYTSITQPPSIFGPTITFSQPNPPIISTSASEAFRSGPSFFRHTSAPCTSICSTVTTPVAASVPCNFPSSISTLDISPSRSRAETPPAVPQMSAEGPKTTSVRYGISSIPVNHSANELLKDNSGILISGLSGQWTLKIDFKNSSIHVYENGKVSVELSKPHADGFMYHDKVGNAGETFAAEHSLGTNSVNGNYPSEKEVSSNAYWLMPKLKDSDYFIEPRVEELAIKESFEPGFCSHVKDFVVGHQRYGRIKFLGETDVRQLDVNSHIVFRNHEVILSMDENKKPPVGHGLNKPAEITLCNIKCVDKAGNQYINGPKVEKYKKKLMKKAAEQGAEFVSYDPVQGEWKFRVEHF